MCVKVQSFWLVKHVVHIPLSIKALADISCTAFTFSFAEIKQFVYIYIYIYINLVKHVNIKDELRRIEHLVSLFYVYLFI